MSADLTVKAFPMSKSTIESFFGGITVRPSTKSTPRISNPYTANTKQLISAWSSGQESIVAGEQKPGFVVCPNRLLALRAGIERGRGNRPDLSVKQLPNRNQP